MWRKYKNNTKSIEKQIIITEDEILYFIQQSCFQAFVTALYGWSHGVEMLLFCLQQK